MTEIVDFLRAQVADSAVYFICGMILCAVILKIIPFGDRVRQHRGLIILFGGIVAAFVGYAYFPLDPRWDSARTFKTVFAGAIGGAVGAILGYAIGQLFLHYRKKQGGSVLPLILGTVGFFAAELVDLGSSKVLSSALDPAGRYVNKDPTQITFAQFRKVQLADPDVGPLLTKIERTQPIAVENYLQWTFDTVRSGWRAGHRSDALHQYVFTQSGLKTDTDLLLLPDSPLQDLLAARIKMFEQLRDVDPSICAGSIGQLGLKVPSELEQKMAEGGISMLMNIMGADRTRSQPLLAEAEFQKISENILSTLYAKYGDDVYVFTGETKLTLANATSYCSIEIDFMREIAALPSGPSGPKEEYYRTLTATLLQQLPQ